MRLNHIKYGRKTTKIEFVDKKEAQKGRFIGIFDPQMNEIKILDDLHGIDLLDTILHEIIHLIVVNADRKIRSEEPTVDIIATGLAKIFRQNKHLVKFMNQCLKNE